MVLLMCIFTSHWLYPHLACTERTAAERSPPPTLASPPPSSQSDTMAASLGISSDHHREPFPKNSSSYTFSFPTFSILNSMLNSKKWVIHKLVFGQHLVKHSFPECSVPTKLIFFHPFTVSCLLITRHEICQTFYTSRLLTKNFLPESA